MTVTTCDVTSRRFVDRGPLVRRQGPRVRDRRRTPAGRVPGAADDGPSTQIADLVELRYDDGNVELYQFPLAYYSEPEARLDHAFVGWWEDDRARLGARLRRPARPRGDGRLRCDAFDDRAGRATLRFERSPAQSSTWRRTRRCSAASSPTPRSPSARTRSSSCSARSRPAATPTSRSTRRSPRPAPSTSPRSTAGSEARHATTALLHLGMLQEFLRTATDGWDLALSSVRDLFAEEDLHADEVGRRLRRRGRPARRARWREVHANLAELLRRPAPPATAARAGRRDDASGSTRRSPSCPSSRARRAPARALRRAGGARRAGRAAHPRRPPPRPDPAHRQGLEDHRLRGRAGQDAGRAGAARLPLRDVAGMLRSFDYAARGRSHPAGTTRPPPSSAATAPRSGPSATARFLDGYSGGELDARAAAPCSRLRSRQGGLRGRLRGPQPADLAVRSRCRRRPGSEQLTVTP